MLYVIWINRPLRHRSALLHTVATATSDRQSGIAFGILSAPDTGNGAEQGIIFRNATTQRREGFRRGGEARLPAARRGEGGLFRSHRVLRQGARVARRCSAGACPKSRRFPNPKDAVRRKIRVGRAAEESRRAGSGDPERVDRGDRRGPAQVPHGLSTVKEVNMVGEFERIALTRDLPAEGLVAGDAGTVVHVYEGGKGYEVEFFALRGRTRAVATVRAGDVRPVGDEDITHARTRERSEA